MKPPCITPVRRLFRSPRVVVAELAGLALVGIVGAVVPQAGTASAAEVEAFRHTSRAVASLVAALGLDHVFRGPIFVGLALLTAVSLAIIVAEQFGRLRNAWAQTPMEAHFQSAPFRAEFERPARAAFGRAEPSFQFWMEKKIGLAGSPILHVGLLLIILAGACRAYFGVDAAVDVMEGETLQRGAQAWVAQWPAPWGKPFGLETPVTLKQVSATRYPGGGLRGFRAELSMAAEGAPARQVEIAVNRDLQVPGGRVRLGSEFGAGALVQWQMVGAEPVRQAALLSTKGPGRYETALSGPQGMTAFLRAEVDEDGSRPRSVEVRVMKADALLAVGDVAVGSALSLPGGGKLLLHETPFWARLRGSRDPALWLAYAGIGLAILGAALIFVVIKVDYCVWITPLGDRERVFVATKPQRFAPLFEEHFCRLLREQGAPQGSGRLLGAPASPSAAGPGARTSLSAAAAEPLPPSSRHLLSGTPTDRIASPSNETQPLATRLAGGISIFICLLLLTGCQRPLQQQARELVERYNQVVAEAYRRGDVKLIDPVVGDSEGKKLAGLIGVRLDLGLTLDSELLELQVLRAEKSRDDFQVWTRERWRYRDRKIGSGAQVGEESVDDYEMLYLFKRKGQSWLAEELRFNSPPKVGRRQMTWLAERKPAQTPGSLDHGNVGTGRNALLPQPAAATGGEVR